MQMIPNRIGPNCSRAEREIFSQLADLEIDGWDYAFHSLNLPEHDRKRVCEIDFLLLGKRGLLVLEVKGGAISRRNGVWHTLDLKGVRHKLKESPFDQAKSSMFALEGVLRRTVGTGLVGRTVFGYAAAFPNCNFDMISAEWAPEMLIDSARLHDEGWASCLDSLGTYWEAKPGRRGALSSNDIDCYVSALRPDFDRVLSLRRLDDQLEQDLVALTERQYSALDRHRRNPRLVFEGGAGTGKTMLAIEMCRRAIDSDTRILLTCSSSILAAFIHAQPDLGNITVSPFDQVADYGADAFDVVVVDEAQDVVNKRDLDTLEHVLSGGLSDGRWAFLLDSNNQRGLVGRYEDDAMAMLQLHRPANVDLLDNCRNTIEIVLATQNRTGADLGVTTAGHGREVVVVETSPRKAALEVAEALADLEARDVSLEQVVLLSPYGLAESVFAGLPPEWYERVDVLDLLRMRRPGRGRIGFATVADFKGLESRYVVLECDETADEADARSQLYVGMTRAKAALWIIKPTQREAAW